MFDFLNSNELEYEDLSKEDKKVDPPRLGSRGYLVDEEDSIFKMRGRGEVELLVEGETYDGESGMFAGRFPRYLIENAEHEPRQPTWIGYQKKAGEIREVPIDYRELFRHIAIFGTSGCGKSTLLKILMNQWGYAGHGFCFIDPKGDTSKELVKELPWHRVDDVIWIEPSPIDYDRVVGLNFLDVEVSRNDPRHERQVKSVIEDLVAILKGGDYWGQKMNSITTNIARGMILSDHNYSLIDMYYVLSDAESRQKFADAVEAEGLDFIHEYTEKIAEMENDDLDPVIRRLKDWVENRITREIVASRDSSVNILEAINSGKIILVRNTVADDDVKKMISTGVFRRVWAAIQLRAETVPEHERDPFMLVADEADDVLSEDMDVERMLSKGRSMKLSLTLASQHPNQISKEILDEIEGNCNAFLAMNVKNPDGAGLLAKRFRSVDWQDIVSLGKYKCYTKITKERGEESEVFMTHTFPDYPPLRDDKEVEKVIQSSLDRYGNPRLKDEDIAEQVEIPTDLTPKNRIRDGVLDSVFTLLSRSSREWVSMDAVMKEVGSRFEEVDLTRVSRVVEGMDGELVELRKMDGELKIRLTDEGVREAGSQDTGGRTGGKNMHRYPLKRAKEEFTSLGYSVELVEQEEGEELPDGIARVTANSPGWLDGFSGGRDLAIEVESSTVDTPAKVLKNLRKALDMDRRCVFVVDDGEGEKGDMCHWAERVSSIVENPVRRVEDGERTFYNKNKALGVGKNDEERYVVRKAVNDSRDKSEWVEDEGEVVLLDQTGSEHARFESIQELRDVDVERVPGFYRYDKSSKTFVVNARDEKHHYDTKERMMEDWFTVSEPFIPEFEFENLDNSDYLIVVLPDEDKDEYGEAQVYQEGVLHPLSEYVKENRRESGSQGRENGGHSFFDA